ncbi:MULTISPECIES: Na/Pi cotransporter family protein [Clostridium]|uniref:Na/Pi cotransporter family protein n=1 Tax=Clostridium TaxID=1485 RepID=UPI00210C6B60|nr:MULTISPECIES: Na/Pi cotransporter family protein [Clostridium]MBS5506120.1 Na/Pi cotransporter family protein [Oscillospiraceae bacterium]MCB5927462.1 Na/Pi cotransporter family protein [bacterium 210820-DFI.5.26]MCQ5160557.1 Na/Pi cotransporter family protein [Clostridium sp. DFI.5.61]
MSVSGLLSLLGGLALFLYGMQMMSSGLEAAAGSKMKLILERLTANRFLGVLVGAGITAVIQSSSATTVMVVGFVNSGMMTLNQAVWIIMGANIGTTITGQLIALDVGALAPLFAFIGVAMVVFVKMPRAHHIGQIMAGLGVLFIGMEMMSSSMMPLRDSQAFVDLMTRFSNPLLGIAVGALFTALIQSSSASVGILQALATSGAISFSSSVFILFGQNIGTCITAVLASIGTSRSAKRATIIHLMFNIIGTVLFTILCILFPLADLVASFTPDAPAAQIANMHTIFNIVTTLLLLPLGNQLASLAVRILPEQPEENRDEMHLEYLTPVQVSSKDGNLGASAIHIGQLQQELDRMLDMAQDNIETSFDAVLSRNSSLLTKAEKMESYLDFLNKEISKYISRLITYETNEQGSSIVSSYFTITGNIERIGDHAINICGYSKLLEERHIQFSAQAQEEICQMRDICLEALNALHQREAGDLLWLTDVSALEQRIDDMTDLFRKDQLERMKAGICSDEACILYSELLTDFERIGDHVLNIAQEMSSIREHS